MRVLGKVHTDHKVIFGVHKVQIHPSEAVGEILNNLVRLRAIEDSRVARAGNKHVPLGAGIDFAERLDLALTLEVNMHSFLILESAFNLVGVHPLDD